MPAAHREPRVAPMHRYDRQTSSLGLPTRLPLNRFRHNKLPGASNAFISASLQKQVRWGFQRVYTRIVSEIIPLGASKAFISESLRK